MITTKETRLFQEQMDQEIQILPNLILQDRQEPQVDPRLQTTEEVLYR